MVSDFGIGFRMGGTRLVRGRIFIPRSLLIYVFEIYLMQGSV
jgi:hypothetical protein